MERRHFLKASAASGGGLLISFVLPRAWAQDKQDRHERPPEAAVGQAVTRASAEAAGLSPNAFIRIDREGVTFTVHKVEMGQATFTSIPMLIAEELEIDPAQVRLVQAPPDNDKYADPLLGGQVTGGSTSVRGAWEPLRRAGATARMLLIAAAAQEWSVDPASCRARDGAVFHDESGRKLSYGELADKAASLPPPKDVALKQPKDFRLIGKSVKRLDSAEKVDGRAKFGIDARPQGLRFAAVAASPIIGARLASMDEAKARALPGVREVLQVDDAVAVLADHTGAALQGLTALDIKWADSPHAEFSTEALVREMETASQQSGAQARNDGDVEKALQTPDAKRLDAVYQLPLLAHATMEPLNCTVDLKADGCDVWVGTQVPTFAQAAAAKVAGLPIDQVRVHNHYLGGGFGRRLEVDFIGRAVGFARLVKGPVQYFWSREEDVRQDMFRPYYYDRLSAALDTDGRPLAWTHRTTGSSIMARFAPDAVKDGVDSDAVEGAKDMPYEVPNVRVEYVRHEPPVPTAFWRGVGATHNIFVVESFIDELAHAAQADPFEYRRSLLGGAPREKAVLELAAQKAGWSEPLRIDGEGRSGRGIAVQFAFGTYMAQVAEVSVDDEGEVRVHRVVCALDCGQAVNPDSIAAQIEGGIVYGLSAVLWEAVRFEGGRVQQSNFHDYRVMRLNEMPQVEVHIVPSTETPGGIGETGTSCIAPAVTNAIFAATGNRVRELPLKPEALRRV